MPGPLLGHLPLEPGRHAVRKPGSREGRLHAGGLAPVLAEAPADSRRQPPNVSE